MPFLWGPTQATAFQELQTAITTSPVLLLPDYGKPFTLITDASDYATGAILEQEDTFGQSHPMAYYSKSLQPAERNYEIHDKELLAIVHALTHFRHYLQGNVHQTKFFLTTQISNTSRLSKLSHVIKCVGPFCWELTTTSSFQSLANSIKQTLCPGVQTIKRG